MDTSHLVTSIDAEKIDTEDIYDEAQIESSINEIVGASSSLEQIQEDWVHSVSRLVEESTERYYSAAVDYIDGRRHSLDDEAQDMAETLHELDQSLELLSMRTGARNNDYRERFLEVKNRLENEVVAPLTARALEQGEFTQEIPEPERDYLLRPVRDRYLEKE
ncbi:MAG: hypothetical protein ABEJ36_04325 [Candidatus Nanosalina sp.]